LPKITVAYKKARI